MTEIDLARDVPLACRMLEQIGSDEHQADEDADRQACFIGTVTCALIKEMADEIEAEINARYQHSSAYPSERRRRERDMALVDLARMLLEYLDDGEDSKENHEATRSQKAGIQ